MRLSASPRLGVIALAAYRRTSELHRSARIDSALVAWSRQPSIRLACDGPGEGSLKAGSAASIGRARERHVRSNRLGHSGFGAGTPRNKIWCFRGVEGGSIWCLRSTADYLVTTDTRSVQWNLMAISHPKMAYIAMAIPIPLLWQLRVSLKKKLALMVLFSSGIFVIAAALLRIIMTLKANPSALNVNRWGVRETIAGIVAINVPIIRPSKPPNSLNNLSPPQPNKISPPSLLPHLLDSQLPPLNHQELRTSPNL